MGTWDISLLESYFFPLFIFGRRKVSQLTLKEKRILHFENKMAQVGILSFCENTPKFLWFSRKILFILRENIQAEFHSGHKS